MSWEGDQVPTQIKGQANHLLSCFNKGKIKYSVCMHAKSLQSYSTLCNPMNYSPPGSSVHGISQARILAWFPFPSSGDLPNPGIEPTSVVSPAMAGRFFTSSATWKAQDILLQIIINCSVIQAISGHVSWSQGSDDIVKDEIKLMHQFLSTICTNLSIQTNRSEKGP